MNSRDFISASLQPVYHQSVLAALERQFRFDRVLRDECWRIDLAAGEIVFDFEAGDGIMPIQLIGTEATANSSWLWAWANESSHIPPKLLKSVEEVRKFGNIHRSPELTTAEQPLNGLSGHFFTLLASGICQADAYFAAPYEGGVAFFLLDWPAIRANPDDLLARATYVIPRGISSVPIPDHKLAIREYLNVLGLTAQEKLDTLVVERGKSPVLRIEFDDQNRMTKFMVLVGDVTTPIPTEVKPLLPTLD